VKLWTINDGQKFRRNMGGRGYGRRPKKKVRLDLLKHTKK